MVRNAHCPELTERLLMCPWQRREIIPMFLTTEARGPHQVTTWQSGSLCRNRWAIALCQANPELDGQTSCFLYCEPFAALAYFKLIIEKARKQAHHELQRNTPGSPSAKFLSAATAIRAYKNRHLGKLMRRCAAWEPFGKCFDQCSFECVDFHGLSQIIASLTRERITEREAAAYNLPYADEKRQRLGPMQTHPASMGSKKPILCLHAVTDEDGHPLEDEDESGMRLCTYWDKIFESRNEDERHPAHETILENVQKDPGYIQGEIDKRKFDEMIDTKKESPRSWTRWYSILSVQVCGWIGLSLLVQCL